MTSSGKAITLASTDTMNAPWSFFSRYVLVKHACSFFDVDSSNAEQVLSNSSPHPRTVADFLEYLYSAGIFRKRPSAHRVTQILERMASAGVLILAGNGNGPAGLDKRYFYMSLEWEGRRHDFRLVPVLGPELLYHLCAPCLVHISGNNGEDAGTGLVVHRSHVLTCRHVVSDMKIDKRQRFQDKDYKVIESAIHKHPRVDIAVIQVNGPALVPLDGALFQDPVVASTIYTLGYPKLPCLREASLIIQQGVVTNVAVTSLVGENLFLYSAIARPGNSGGPVMSDDGYVVGLCTRDIIGEYNRTNGFSPHYAGIPAHVVVEATRDLNLGFEIPFEAFE